MMIPLEPLTLDQILALAGDPETPPEVLGGLPHRLMNRPVLTFVMHKGAVLPSSQLDLVHNRVLGNPNLTVRALNEALHTVGGYSEMRTTKIDFGRIYKLNPVAIEALLANPALKLWSLTDALWVGNLGVYAYAALVLNDEFLRAHVDILVEEAVRTAQTYRIARKGEPLSISDLPQYLTLYAGCNRLDFPEHRARLAQEFALER